MGHQHRRGRRRHGSRADKGSTVGGRSFRERLGLRRVRALIRKTVSTVALVTSGMVTAHLGWSTKNVDKPGFLFGSARQQVMSSANFGWVTVEVPYEVTPDLVKKIQSEYEMLAAEFLKWGQQHGGLVPPALCTLAEGLFASCLRCIEEFEIAGDERGASQEPIVVLSSALSYGMYLGMLGYTADTLTMPALFTEEVERRLLSGDPEGKDSGGAATDGV